MTDEYGSRRFEIVFYSLTLVYVVGMLVQVGGFRNSTARIFPYLFGTATVLLASVTLASVIAPKWVARIAPDVSAGPEMISRERGNLRKATIALIGTFPFAVYLVGFTITIPLYVFALVYTVRGHLLESLLLSIAFTVVWWLVFVRMLHIVFFEGVLF